MRSDNMIDQLCIRKKFPLLNMSWFSFAGVQFWSRGKSRDQKFIFRTDKMGALLLCLE